MGFLKQLKTGGRHLVYSFPFVLFELPLGKYTELATAAIPGGALSLPNLVSLILVVGVWGDESHKLFVYIKIKK